MNSVVLQKYLALKAEGYKEIYFLELNEVQFLFKPLTLLEYKSVTELTKYMEASEVNELIVKMAVLYCNYFEGISDWIEKCKATDPDLIAQEILDTSGFENNERFLLLLEEKRTQAGQITSLITMLICSAFRSVNPWDVDNMTLEEQLDLFCKAEEMLNSKVDFDQIFSKQKPDPRESAAPVPQDMETTSVLSEDLADIPDLDKIMKGEGII